MWDVASVPVTDPTTFPGIPIVESEAQKAGINYHGPSGKPIPNCGEQQVKAFTNEGILCAMKWQIAEGIRRPLIATSNICKRNNYVIHDKDRGWIFNKDTGATTEFRMENGVYVMDLWVQVFPRQGR